MPGESLFKQFRDKLEKNRKGRPTEREDLVDEDGNVNREFAAGLPDFLDPTLPEAEREANRGSFKLYIEKQDRRFLETADKILQGDTEGINAEAFTAFTEHAAAFKEDWEAAKKLAERLSDDMVERMAKNAGREGIGQYAYTFGTQTVAKIWRDKIPGLVVNDKEKFDSLKAAITEHETLEKLASSSMAEQAKKLGIQENRYVEAMADEDPESRRAKLREAMDRKYDRAYSKNKELGVKAGKFWSYATRGAESLAKKGRAELEQVMADMDEQIALVSELIADATSDNTEIQRALLATIAPRN